MRSVSLIAGNVSDLFIPSPRQVCCTTTNGGAFECAWKSAKILSVQILVWSHGLIRYAGSRVFVHVESHVLPLEHQLWVQGSQPQGQFFVGTTVQDAFQKKICRNAEPVRESGDEEDAGCAIATLNLVEGGGMYSQQSGTLALVGNNEFPGPGDTCSDSSLEDSQGVRALVFGHVAFLAMALCQIQKKFFFLLPMAFCHKSSSHREGSKNEADE